MNPRLVVVGDVLLDRDVIGSAERIAPDAPVPVLAQRQVTERPGGAGLAAVLAAADGHPVCLVTALGGDEAGRRIRELLAAAGVELVTLPYTGSTPQKTRLRTDGQVLLRLDRDEPGEIGDAPPAVRRALDAADVIVVSDYGRGVAAVPAIREALSGARRPIVWDPHPRGPAPVAGCRLVTPNEREIVPDGFSGGRLARIAAAAAQARGRWSAAAVVVTLGSDGALLSQNDAVPLLLPAPRCGGTDPCGAGDRFATAAAIELARGALTSEAVQRAVTRATAFVEAGGAASIGVDPSAVSRATGARTDGPFGHLDRTAIQQATNAGIDGPLAGDPGGIVTRVRARGGAVVATGGCFDILHAGHIATLRAARELGDCLVVCVNSDESVRALKGPDRPLTPVHDRITMLRSLSCVDSVEVFDQPTPIQLLERLRPDVWVKGGDYYFDDTGDGPAMPEAEVLRTWGGQAVVVPYLSGYSTTGIIHAASIRGAGAKQDGRSTDA